MWQKNWGRNRQTLPQIEKARKFVRINFDVYPYIASSTSLLPQYLEKADRVLITWSDPYPEVSGLELNQTCADWNVSTKESVELLSPAGTIYFQMD